MINESDKMHLNTHVYKGVTIRRKGWKNWK